jgi:hypothetical protein
VKSSKQTACSIGKCCSSNRVYAAKAVEGRRRPEMPQWKGGKRISAEVKGQRGKRDKLRSNWLNKLGGIPFFFSRRSAIFHRDLAE